MSLLRTIYEERWAILLIIAFGTVVGLAIAFALGEILWLLSPSGQWFNSDTIPLQVSLTILLNVLTSPFVWILCVPFGIVVVVIGITLWDES